MNESKQVALLPEPENLNPIQLLQIAVSKGVDAEQLKLLMELQREWKAEQARDAFVRAMNDFRAEALKIVKTKQVSFGTTAYKHATLANTVEVAAPALSKHGLSHRWETKQELDGAFITVSCVITHQMGHSERTSLSAASDTSGGKNAVQAVGSTVSYLQRYTFMAITGLAAHDQDDDGGGPKLDAKRMKTIVGGLQKAVTDKDAESAKKIWGELTNPERELVWSELRSVSALRAAIKKLLGGSKKPPAGDDLAPWSLSAIAGSADLEALGAVWRTIQDAYSENDLAVPGDVETCYVDRKAELHG